MKMILIIATLLLVFGSCGKKSEPKYQVLIKNYSIKN